MVSPGRLPTGVLRSRIRARADTYTIHRPQNTTDGWEQSDTFDTHSANLDVFTTDTAQQQLPTGTKTNAVAAGYCLAGEDVQAGDLIQYGGEVMEVQPKDPIPATGDTALFSFDLHDRDDVMLP